jgi:hypothetical protein
LHRCTVFLRLLYRGLFGEKYILGLKKTTLHSAPLNHPVLTPSPYGYSPFEEEGGERKKIVNRK